MKKIEAIIRRTRFDDVKEALLEADIEWFSYYEVRGVGKTREARIYRGVAYDTSSIERILISIVVREKNVEKTIQAVMKATDAYSSYPWKTPYAYARESVATSRSTTPSTRNSGRHERRKHKTTTIIN